MSKAETPEGFGNFERKWLGVEHNGKIYNLEVAKTPAQLAEAKALDDLVFAGHVGITIEELNEIANNGAVLLMRDKSGNLIGESQVLTSPIAEHPNLDSDEAYNYGTAIYPGLQNHGLAQILFKGQERVALEAGKSKSTLTVRLENAQSIRGRFKFGFSIVGYDPDRYGSYEEGGARLIMEKKLSGDNGITPPYILAGMVDQGQVKIFKHPTDHENTFNEHLLGVGVNSGDKTDHEAHAIVDAIFKKNGFLGIGILKSSEIEMKIDQASMLIFRNK